MRPLPILELRKVYVDNLAEWVEIPVYEQDDVIKLVNEIDWDGLDMWQYKKILVEHWVGLPQNLKAKIKNPAVRDELYDALIHENWGLAPGKALNSSSFYTKTEEQNVQLWFASNKIQGRPPEVLGGASG